MSLSWQAAVTALDAATALSTTLNLSYFVDRLLAGEEEAPRRRIAAFALAVVSLGVLLESVAFLASAVAGREEIPASPEWALLRLVPFAGAATISVLILRRAAGGADPR